MMTRSSRSSEPTYAGTDRACPRTPAVDGEWVLLRDGRQVQIRQLIQGDEEAVTSWFAGLGAETRYARFLAALERLDRRTRSELAGVDHVRHEAIAAVAPAGATIGIARYIRLGQSNAAEVAVAVADAWRAQGIATMLLDRVTARARVVGIQQFVATCLATNSAIIRLLSRLGEATVGPSICGVVELRIDLRGGR